jgi:NADH-quinone oxidoreductase subunit L
MEELEIVRNIAQVPHSALALVLMAPLAGFLLNALRTLVAAGGGPRPGEGATSFFACAGALLSFLFAAAAFLALRSQPEGSVLVQPLFPWIESGELHVPVGLQMDPLSALMALFVTFTASVIHVYSIGYMKGDAGHSRYFAYLNLFLFFMLLLILSDGLLAMFVGWEGVGLCSYLLISFWFTDAAKAEAGKKAFLANRVGDAGFLVGIFLAYTALGSLNFAEMQSSRGAMSALFATATCLAFFMGAAGKSAQIPLYVWLPDAMAGPTPVSALIHAATMVTAGVYMVARLHFLFALSPVALTVVAVIGAATALLAALIAVAQNDIKKVLAYSTVSQLGLMFLGAGTGGYSSGIFHVMTHAFFKAGLFLGAGSVIHAMHGEQDIRRMGGLRKHIPVTTLSFAAAWLAISGLPPFAGFFSKDEILWRALATPNLVLPWLPTVLFATGVCVSFLTAFYMTRLFVLTFFGEFRGTREQEEKVHESPAVMTGPLIVLAVLSVGAGWLGLPHAVGGNHWVGHFLEPVFGHSTPEASALPETLEPWLMLFATLLALSAVWAAWVVYLREPKKATARFQPLAPLKRWMQERFYVDELYDATVLAFVRFLSAKVSFRFMDRLVIERAVEMAAAAGLKAAEAARRVQVGTARAYLAYLLVGAGLLLWWVTR